jgi:hypothetical protein
MSNNDKPRGYQPAKITIDDVERLTKLFKEIFAEQPLIKWSIYLAGLGGLCETLHFAWLVLKHFLQ